MIEILLDASQIELFERCPRAWFYAYVLNLTPLHSKAAFAIGSYYHEVLALYYALPLAPPISTALKPINELHHTAHAKLGSIAKLSERMRAAVDFAASPDLLKKYNIKDIEEQKFHRKRIVDYLYHWANEDESIESLAVEQGFSTLLYEDDRRRYILEGKIDLVCRTKTEGLSVMDHKTQSRFDDKWEFNHQVCNYLSFTGANYFIYNYIGLQDKLPLEGLRRRIYKPHPQMLEQWKREVFNTFREMENYMDLTNCYPFGEIIDNGAGFYPRRRSACTSRYGLCQFTKLCSVPDDSKFKPAVLSAYKEKDNKWRAWT